MTTQDLPVAKPPRTLTKRYVRHVIRWYGRTHGWVMHRLMVDQHVQTCLTTEYEPLQEMIRDYERARRQRRRRIECLGSTLSMCGLIAFVWMM